MTFKTPLQDRLRIAQRRRERYATDSAFRLTLVNRMRIRSGRPTLNSAEEIPSYSEASRALAARRQRDEKGRFL